MMISQFAILSSEIGNGCEYSSTRRGGRHCQRHLLRHGQAFAGSFHQASRLAASCRLRLITRNLPAPIYFPYNLGTTKFVLEAFWNEEKRTSSHRNCSTCLTAMCMETFRDA